MFLHEMTMAFPALGEGFKFWETWTGRRSGALGVSREFYQNSSGYAFFSHEGCDDRRQLLVMATSICTLAKRT